MTSFNPNRLPISKASRGLALAALHNAASADGPLLAAAEHVMTAADGARELSLAKDPVEIRRVHLRMVPVTFSGGEVDLAEYNRRYGDDFGQAVLCEVLFDDSADPNTEAIRRLHAHARIVSARNFDIDLVAYLDGVGRSVETPFLLGEVARARQIANEILRAAAQNGPGDSGPRLP